MAKEEPKRSQKGAKKEPKRPRCQKGQKMVKKGNASRMLWGCIWRHYKDAYLKGFNTSLQFPNYARALGLI